LSSSGAEVTRSPGSPPVKYRLVTSTRSISGGSVTSVAVRVARSISHTRRGSAPALNIAVQRVSAWPNAELPADSVLPTGAASTVIGGDAPPPSSATSIARTAATCPGIIGMSWL
jgi:hypothetical protein